MYTFLFCFANSPQETGENTKQWLTVRQKTEVSDWRVVLRSQVPQTHGQDPRIGNHHSLHEAEESCWFRWVYSLASFVSSVLGISPQVLLCGQKYFLSHRCLLSFHEYKIFAQCETTKASACRVDCRETDRRKVSHFGKILDLNVGFTLGKQFILQSKPTVGSQCDKMTSGVLSLKMGAVLLFTDFY